MVTYTILIKGTGLFKSGITIFAWRTTYSLFNPVLLTECSCSPRKYWFLLKMISAQQIDHFYSWICSWPLLYALLTLVSGHVKSYVVSFKLNKILSICFYYVLDCYLSGSGRRPKLMSKRRFRERSKSQLSSSSSSCFSQVLLDQG